MKGPVRVNGPYGSSHIANPRDKDYPMDYPEHDKLSKIKDQSQAIGEFVSWLNWSNRIYLCKAHEHSDGCFVDVPDREVYLTGTRGEAPCNIPAHKERVCGASKGEFIPVLNRIEDLLAGYFHIDLAKLEKEKRAMLDEIRCEDRSAG